jgi:hypothetical protein
MVKISFFQFLNTGVFVVGAEVIANFNNFTLNDGICGQVTIIMLLNAIIPNVSLFFLNYFDIINKIMRLLAEKEYLKLTQLELNEIFLPPPA